MNVSRLELPILKTNRGIIERGAVVDIHAGQNTANVVVVQKELKIIPAINTGPGNSGAFDFSYHSSCYE